MGKLDTFGMLEALRKAALDCTDCPLYARATQTVFGEGGRHAELMLVGEQPGDQEDLQGRPFVGPAGKLLDRALEAAGIDRKAVYVTNAVKHFKWEPRGKHRLHKTPAQREIEACKQWLQGEIAAIRPEVIVALGGTAGRSLLGRAFRIGADRGRAHATPYGQVVPTTHPSAILRLREAAGKDAAFAALVKDLRVARKRMAR